MKFLYFSLFFCLCLWVNAWEDLNNLGKNNWHDDDEYDLEAILDYDESEEQINKIRKQEEEHKTFQKGLDKNINELEDKLTNRKKRYQQLTRNVHAELLKTKQKILSSRQHAARIIRAGHEDSSATQDQLSINRAKEKINRMHG